MATQRVCKCGCGKLFPVPVCRPGTEYSFGHKPKPPGRAVAPAQGIAMQTARLELKALAEVIDELDDRIAAARESLHSLEAQKENATDRHLTVATSIDILAALIDGKSVRELAAEETAA